MRMTVPILAVAAALTGCGQTSDSACVTEAAPSIRLPAVPGGPGAGYFQISSESALVSVSSPRVQRIEMHETMSSGQMSAMRPLARATAGSCGIVFSPGGRHLMLFGIDPTVRPGDQVPLVMQFERGPARTLSATVRNAGN
jgi:copper(I)-binding protein